MTPDDLLHHVTTFYIESDDFNGMPVPSAAATGLNSNTELIRHLVEAGLLYVNYGDRHPNPHILAFGPEPLEQQLAKLDAADQVSGCLYPTQMHLADIVDQARYAGRPYTLELALGLPQLGHHFFDLSVLEAYRNDPRYYYKFDISGMISVDDGHYEQPTMESRDQAFMQSFGLALARHKGWAVVAYRRYLHTLSPEHQQIWRAKQEPNRDNFHPHPDYVRTSIFGEWPEKLSLFEATLLEIREINKLAQVIGRPPLFRNTYEDNARPRDFGYLIRPTARELSAFAQLLDKMLSDNINRDFFQEEVPYEDETTDRHGRIRVSQRGTIRILEEWLKAKYRTHDIDSAALVKDAINAFKKVRGLRNPSSHLVGLDDYKVEFFDEQSALMREVVRALRTLRQVLQSHPSAASYEVSHGVEMDVWGA